MEKAINNGKKEIPPRISVLMPTFNHAHLIGRAIESLRAQTLTTWELIIVDDGSLDATVEKLQPYILDERIHYFKLEHNSGLGAALNYALRLAHAQLIAYLPSDDIYFADHLSTLLACLNRHPQAILAYSGLRFEVRTPGTGCIDYSSSGKLTDYPLQLVQVVHRRTEDCWMERSELVTDDLDIMFWSRLQSRGSFIETNKITCQWVDHPWQRHKLIQEPSGGLYPYRGYYQVGQPLRFHSTKGNYIDEFALYQPFTQLVDRSSATGGLKILLVGELSHNPERVLAFEERGHRLYGLWSPNVHWCNAIGPFPFGHIENLPRHGWREAITRIKPDIIYAQLNWIAVPFVHHVLMNSPGIPFIWHFKEGPFDCIANGTWPELIDLYTRSDGQIYCNAELRDWFHLIAPGTANNRFELILDGDLPKRDWFTNQLSPRLSTKDGKIHLVVPGNLNGNWQPSLVAQLMRHDIHLHMYGDSHINFAQTWIAEALRLAPNHLHLHHYVDPSHWVSEFSQYDAGWLHIFQSQNNGDLFSADWYDLNYPARLTTLAAAGVPWIQYDNQGSIVAVQSLARQMDLGLFYRDIDHLAEQLYDEKVMERLRKSIWSQRSQFAFDTHVDSLIDFFHQVLSR